MEMLIGLIVTLGVPAYFIAQPMALLRWQGRWRKLALMPLVLVIPALAYSVFAFADGSNLWPITLIAAAAIGMIYLSIVWLLQWWLVRG